MEKLTKPKLNFWQIWNLSFGFLGVQFGFALQNANASRILSNLGADPHNLSYFWLVAPTMGLLVQPLVGAASDKTWTRVGRRSPYILGGAVFSMLAMFFLPNSPYVIGAAWALTFGAVMFAMMDAAFNVTFQPFRALVADMLPQEQRDLGYSVQSFLINTGAVLGSALPFILTALGVANEAPPGEVPPSVIWSFYVGGSMLILSVLVTVFKTREYPPTEFAQFNAPAGPAVDEAEEAPAPDSKSILPTMGPLALVQLFSWFPLFLMWVYTTSAVAQHYWGTAPDDTQSPEFNAAGNWVGICFAAYSLVAALYSVALPSLIRLLGRKGVYSLSLALGGLGYLSMVMFTNPNMLLVSMVGIGAAWAGILAMPYMILSNVLPAKRMGVFMGLFNLTVVVPQILSGVFGGSLLQAFGGQAIKMLMLAGGLMLLGSVAVFLVRDKGASASSSPAVPSSH